MTNQTLKLLDELEKSARRRRPLLVLGLFGIVTGFAIYAAYLNQVSALAVRQAEEWKAKANSVSSTLAATRRAMAKRDYDLAAQLLGMAINQTKELVESASSSPIPRPVGALPTAPAPRPAQSAAVPAPTPAMVSPKGPVLERAAGGEMAASPVSNDASLLTLHNRERALVGVPPLVWDPRLAAAAAGYARDLAELGRLQHSSRESRSGAGENLAMGTLGRYTPQRLTELWLAEKRTFVNGLFPAVSTRGSWGSVGHYTAMIWRGTTSVGCGTATDDRQLYLVCRYAPAGNVIGQRVY